MSKILYAWSHNRGRHVADNSSLGEICDVEGKLLSIARPYGYTPGVIQPTHVPGLCEQSGCSEESTADQHIAAMQAYLTDVPKFTEKMLWDIMSARHPIERGCCIGHSGLVTDLEIAGLL